MVRSISGKQQKPLTQLARLREQLLALEPEVTAQDRKKLAQKLNITKSCISQYLHGNIRNTDRAIEMISILHECLQKREVKISQLCTLSNKG